MGSELSKRYNVDRDATATGGHGYQWKVYDATRKKDGLECSVFVFDKAALEKKLGSKNATLTKRIVEIMRRDCNALAELAGVSREDLAKSRAVAPQPNTLREQVMQGMSEKMGASTTRVATATRRSPPGVLQLMETFENRQALVFVGERTVTSIGNAVRGEGCAGLSTKSTARDWRSVVMSAPEVARGVVSLCEALAATHAGFGGACHRRLHLGVSPEAVFISKAGGWRLGGYGFALPLPEKSAAARNGGVAIISESDRIPCPFFEGGPSRAGSGGGGGGYGSRASESLAEATTGKPRLSYCAPELTLNGGGFASRVADTFSVACVVYELFGDRRSLLGDNVGDSAQRHQSAASAKLDFGNVDVSHLPTQLRDVVGNALVKNPASRPDPTSLRSAPGLHTNAARAFRELDRLAVTQGAAADQAAPFLTSLPVMLLRNQRGEEEAFDDRAIRVAVVPALEACLKNSAAATHCAPAVFACARRLDARDFRTFVQPLLEKLVAGSGAVLFVVDEASLILEKADAVWAATKVTEAFCRALSDAAGPATHELALRRLAESETLDALLAKNSLADPKQRSAASTHIVPAVCRLAVLSPSLGLKVQALKTIAACLERPTATPPETLDSIIAPSLAKLVTNIDNKPALAMCILGCFDALAKRLKSDKLATTLLPALAPMLEEKSLNSKQFEMVVSRLEGILTSVVSARREEIGNLPPSMVSANISTTRNSSSASPLRSNKSACGGSSLGDAYANNGDPIPDWFQTTTTTTTTITPTPSQQVSLSSQAGYKITDKRATRTTISQGSPTGLNKQPSSQRHQKKQPAAPAALSDDAFNPFSLPPPPTSASSSRSRQHYAASPALQRGSTDDPFASSFDFISASSSTSPAHQRQFATTNFETGKNIADDDGDDDPFACIAPPSHTLPLDPAFSGDQGSAKTSALNFLK